MSNAEAAKTDVVCAGVVVADHLSTPIDHVPAPGELVMADDLILEIGGCASNVAVDLAKLGVSCQVTGCVGSDVFGRYVAETLRARGVDTQYLTACPDRPTSQTLIVNVKGEDRRFIHCFGANAEFGTEHIPLQAVQQAKVLYVGGYLILPRLIGPDLARLFEQARASNTVTVLDIVVPASDEPRRDLLERDLLPVLPHTDVFLPNTDEARLLTGIANPLEQAEFFRSKGARTVVVTLGGEGAVLVSDNVRLRAGVFPVEFVDGTGAGDAFDAGYIAGILQGKDERGCLEIASALGASCVRAVGTTPGVFTREECDRFLAEHRLPIEEL